MAEKKVLTQTKSAFKFIGRATRLEKDGAYKEATMDKGKNKGKVYHSLRFGVNTSETNGMTVQMFGFTPEQVFLWNSEKNAEFKKEGKKYKGLRVPFDEWLDTKEDYYEKGHVPIETKVGFVRDEEDKLITKGLPAFVASEAIHANIDNGDTVVVKGDIRYSTWTNPEGKEIAQTTFSIKEIYKIADIDFEDKDFEETTYFEQEMVYVDAVDEKKESKVFVTGRTIDYNGNFQDSQFVINYSDGEGGTDEVMRKLADSFLKKISFGDLIEVNGNALNRAIVEEAEEASEEEDFLATLGGKAKPKHAQRYQNTSYISEMQIEGIDAWSKKEYRESDFVVDNLVDKEKEKQKPTSELDDLGGKKKKDDNNPFADGMIEIDEDDLPF